MDDFVSRLRMNNIFPTAGFNPLQAPTRPDLDVNGILNAISAMQQNARQADMIQEDNIHRRGRTENLQDIGRQNALRQQQEMNNPLRAQGGMNVVLGNDPNAMTGYQKGELQLGRERLAQTANLSGEKLSQTGEIASGKQSIAEGKLDISKQDSATRKARADIYAFKAQHPNMKIVADKGGNFHAIDPITGKSMDTGVETGTLSDAEKLEITGGQAMDRTNANIEGRSSLEDKRHEGNLEEIGARGAESRKTNEAKPTKEESPSQERIRANNKARELVNTRPDLAPFIKIDPNGNFTIKSSGQDVIDQTLQSLIYGKDVKLSPDGKKVVPKEDDTKKPAVKSKYKVSVN